MPQWAGPCPTLGVKGMGGMVRKINTMWYSICPTGQPKTIGCRILSECFHHCVGHLQKETFGSYCSFLFKCSWRFGSASASYANASSPKKYADHVHHVHAAWLNYTFGIQSNTFRKAAIPSKEMIPCLTFRCKTKIPWFTMFERASSLAWIPRTT